MTRGRRQRGSILLAVLVVVVIAALAGTTAMDMTGARAATAHASASRVQARALAWSGVQAALAELAEQRDDLLSGRPPRLTPRWELFTDDLGFRGVVRLVPSHEGAEAVSEAGKLDVNFATEAMLASLEAVGPDLARRIVAERAARPFESVEDLARVPGVTGDVLYGGVGVGERSPRGRRTEPVADGGASAAGLADLLTVFSSDSNIQAGLGEDGDQRRGKLRINLNTPWSDELREAVTERFGKDAADAVERVMREGAKFERDADIVRKLRELNAPPDSWGTILDAFTTCPDPYALGRVDLSAAPKEVLACLPGIDAAAAEAIVSARARLDTSVLLDTAWIVTEGIVPPEKFPLVVDHVTSRSLVWRVRVEAGRLPADADDPLRDRIVVDAVLDVSSERPRVAYLRDVTVLPTALALGRLAEASSDPRDELDAAGSPPGGAPPTPGLTGGPPRSGAGSGSPPRSSADGGANGEPRGGDRSDTRGGASDASGDSARPEPKDRRRGRWTAGGGS